VAFQDGASGYNATVMRLGTTPSPITGITSVCAGDSTALNDITPGGVWGSSNTSVARAGTGTGVVTGVTAGTAIILHKG